MDKFKGIAVYRGNTPVFGIDDWSYMGRKKPVLWIQLGDNSRAKVASFNNEEAAKMFIKVLVAMFPAGQTDKKDWGDIE